MWEGKNKALTLSFDDGVTQDIRLIEILDKYNLKGTFNINSSLLGLPGQLGRNGNVVEHNKINPYNVKKNIFRSRSCRAYAYSSEFNNSWRKCDKMAGRAG